MSNENLNFKITLSGTYWEKRPEFSILLDDVEQASGIVEVDSGTIFDINFSCDVEEDADHILSIKLLNKEDSDTVENADKTVIEKDMLLNIEGVEIDGISLGALCWSLSEYNVPVLPEPVHNCVNLGWNGSWNIKFSSPFYIWLLENM